MIELPDSQLLLRLAWRLGAAAVLGGLVGIEREWEHKAAGLRTHMTVSLASAAFVVIALETGATSADLSRVLQGITVGVGFLGAGTIIKRESEQSIQGLTTAATIWLTAAIGAAAGAGHVAVSVLSVLGAWLILSILSGVDRLIRSRK